MHTFTIIHVIISLIGIVSGAVVLGEFLARKWSSSWNFLFLTSTILTSVTGFFFPFHGFTPAHGVGIVSLVVLAVSLIALYLRHLEGPWRRTYVITAMLAFYFNFFVLVVQAFQKIPGLKVLAPTQTEPAFVVAQTLCLLVFIILGAFATLRFSLQTDSVLETGRHDRPLA